MARVLIISIVYPPDTVSTANIARGLAIGLRDLGHDVGVLTSVPHFNPPSGGSRRVRLLDTETIGDVRIVRGFVLRKTPSMIKRLAGFALLHLAMLYGVLQHFRDREVVIVISPPLTFALIGGLAKLLGRGKLIYNAQELWPDVPRDLGVITSPPLLAVLGWFEQQIYRRADWVVAIGERFARTIAERGGPSARVVTIENFVDTSWITPGKKDNALSRQWDLSDRPVVLYAGNLGLTQDFDLLFEAAERLEGDGVEVLIVGGGAARNRLEAQVEGRSSKNLRLEGYQDEGAVPDLYALADVVAVPLAAGHDHTTTPSKIYSAMAAARPIVACAAPDTDLADAVIGARAGVIVRPGDVGGFVAAVRALLSGNAMDQWSPSDAQRVAREHSAEAVAAAYDRLIRSTP